MSRLRVVAGRPVCNDYLYAEPGPVPVLTDELKHRLPEPLWKRAARWLGEAVIGAVLILIAALCYVVLIGRFG